MTFTCKWSRRDGAYLSRLPWIFPGGPLTFKGIPGNSVGDRYGAALNLCFDVTGIRTVKLPWIFPGALLTFNGTPRNIQGNLWLSSTSLIAACFGMVTHFIHFDKDEAETKWLTFCGRHFQLHLFQWKILAPCFKFHWNMFSWVQLTIIQHWFR